MPGSVLGTILQLTRLIFTKTSQRSRHCSYFTAEKGDLSDFPKVMKPPNLSSLGQRSRADDLSQSLDIKTQLNASFLIHAASFPCGEAEAYE